MNDTRDIDAQEQAWNRILTRVSRDLLVVVCVYVFALLAARSFVPQPDLVAFVSACKIVSFLFLLYENTEMPARVNMDQQPYFKRLNQLIIAYSVIVLLMMLVKLIKNEDYLASIPPASAEVLVMFESLSYVFSSIPVFAYAALNYALLFSRSTTEQDRINIKQFLVFRDLTCAGPLILVLLLTEVYVIFGGFELDPRRSAEIFYSGALAVILLSSAIVTTGLNESQKAAAEQQPV
ncbi:MAG: hypothetical protein AAGI51_16055 [Pseudomonadota bacterium]